METVEIDGSRLFGGIYRGRRVLVTGHTGFKGSWLSLWLSMLGATVFGYALPPVSDEGNFTMCGLKDVVTDIRGDVRDKERLKGIFETFQPEIVFHLAAQPIVRLSYERPEETFGTNVTGTVNVLENVRSARSVKAAVVVTSDKCYENREQLWGYRETDPLGGFDPYSASKGCQDIVSASYARAFRLPVATARAGNVIGGGDWSRDRIVPDCVRALREGNPVPVRNPGAVRPWQFVLEPLYGYLLLAQRLALDPAKYCGAWNFGPESDSAVPVRALVEAVIGLWGSGAWEDLSGGSAVHEASVLRLDCTKAKTLLGWRPRLGLGEALERTVDWYKNCGNGGAAELCRRQIAEYCGAAGGRRRNTGERSK